MLWNWNYKSELHVDCLKKRFKLAEMHIQQNNRFVANDAVYFNLQMESVAKWYEDVLSFYRHFYTYTYLSVVNKSEKLNKREHDRQLQILFNLNFKARCINDIYSEVELHFRFWSVDDSVIHTEYSGLRSIVMANKRESV